jgi:hypothetical protein
MCRRERSPASSWRIVLRIPAAIVIVMSAFWGASAIVGGALVLLGRIEVAALRNGSVDVVIGESVLLLGAWLVLAIVGIAVQWFTRPEAAPPGADAVA